jgi:small multidrug resistance family-3 protein
LRRGDRSLERQGSARTAADPATFAESDANAAQHERWPATPAVASLALFAWLLTLRPTAAGRVYAAYRGVYFGVAVLWLWLVDQFKPTASDWIGVGFCFLGMAVIMFVPRSGGWPSFSVDAAKTLSTIPTRPVQRLTNNI